MASATGGTRGWYHGWNVIIVCVLAGFAANALTVNSFTLFLQPWSRDFHTTISQLQLGIAGMGLVCSLLSPVVGIVSDRLPQRVIIAVGLIGLAVFAAALASAHSVRSYQLLYTLLGPIGITAATSLPANALVARWFVRRRGLAIALTAVGLGLAGIIMPPLIAQVMQVVDWRHIWLTLAAISLFVLTPLALMVLRLPRAGDGTYYLEGAGLGGAGAGAAGHPGHGGGWGQTIRVIATRRTFWLLILAYIPMLALSGGGGQNLAPILTSRGIGVALAGTFVSLYSGAHVTAMLVSGTLSDRIGNRLPLFVLTVLTCTGGVLLATQSSPVLLAVGTVCLGCGGAFWPLLTSAVANEYGAARIGSAMGLMSLFLPLTGVAPFLIAKSKEASGSYAPGLLTLCMIAAVGGLTCFLFLRERRGVVATSKIEHLLDEPAAELF